MYYRKIIPYPFKLLFRQLLKTAALPGSACHVVAYSGLGIWGKLTVINHLKECLLNPPTKRQNWKVICSPCKMNTPHHSTALDCYAQNCILFSINSLWLLSVLQISDLPAHFPSLSELLALFLLKILWSIFPKGFRACICSKVGQFCPQLAKEMIAFGISWSEAQNLFYDLKMYFLENVEV